MGKQRIVPLSEEQRAELTWHRDHDPKAHLREKAAAILKVSSGQFANKVAKAGLLRPRAPATVYQWLDRYEQEGFEGLKVRRGRGRKPAFSP